MRKFQVYFLFSLLTFLQANALDSLTVLTDDTNQEILEKPETQNIDPDQCKNAEIIELKQRTHDDKEEDETNDVPNEKKHSLIKKLKGHKATDRGSSEEDTEPIPCTCGVFLSGQFKKGSKKQPKGLPVLTQEMDTPFMNNAVGNRQCTNKCLEMIIKHLPKSNEIICATVDRDHVYKERAYLFVKNHSDKWHGTNLSAGREFCCRDNIPYKCPVT